MTRLTKLTAGLMGAAALTALSAPAYAVGTAAGTPVDNTFTLTYNTGTATNTITNDGNGGNAAPTTFLVDRVINLTVTGSTSADNSPGDADVPVLFVLDNLGNDQQSYTLSTENGDSQDFAITNGTSGIEFTVIAGTATCTATPPGSVDTYDETAGTPVIPTVPADGRLCVYVHQDIANAATDGQSSNIDLLATTTAPGTTTPLTYGVNNDPATVQNVAIEGTAGPHSGDGDDDGADSATSIYTVGAANVSAIKSVALVSQDGSSCGAADIATAPSPAADELMIPGACVEYTITVTNEGSGEATNIDIVDPLPSQVTYSASAVQASEWSTAPSAFTPGAGTCTATTACTVMFDDGVLPGATVTNTEQVGTVKIRAIVR